MLLLLSLLARPILVLHGLGDSAKDVEPLRARLADAFPGRAVTAVRGLGGAASWRSLDGQVDALLAACEAPSCDVVGHSQGGLVARVAAQRSGRVHTLVSLAAPQCGVREIPPDYAPAPIPELSRRYASLLFYTPPAQKTLSVAQYWRDLCAAYLSQPWLPVENGEDGGTRPLRVQRATFAVGDNDEVLVPPETAIFGCCAACSEGCPLVPARLTPMWRALGLDELEARGDLTLANVTRARHGEWLDAGPVGARLFDALVRPALA